MTKYTELSTIEKTQVDEKLEYAHETEQFITEVHHNVWCAECLMLSHDCLCSHED